MNGGADAQTQSGRHVGRLVSDREKVKMKNAIVNRAKAFLKSEDGPTATEYAVMLALIIVVVITAVKTIGTKANAQFQSVADNL